MTNFYIDQSVVYIDDFMPDTVEIITDMNAEQIIFNHGSRNCIPEMIRPAFYIEQILNKRIFSQDEINQPNVQEYLTSNIEPVLDAPARVGNVKFQKGVRWSTLVECAQRHFEYVQSIENEKPADRSLLQKLVCNDYVLMPAKPTREIYQAFNLGRENENARNAAEAFKFGYAEIVKLLEHK